jgi:uncharacterized protein
MNITDNQLFIRKISKFSKLLIENQIAVEMQDQIMVLESLPFVRIQDEEEFFYALRSILIKKKSDYPTFRKLFFWFWKEIIGWRSPRIEEKGSNDFKDIADSQELSIYENQIFDEIVSGKNKSNEIDISHTTKFFSRVKIDFEKYDSNEIDEAIFYLKKNIVFNQKYRTKSFLASSVNKRINIHKTIRNNFRTGGEITNFILEGKKYLNRPIIFVVDVSRSMRSYTKMSLAFLWIVNSLFPLSVSGYIFSTKLIKLSKESLNQSIFKFIEDAKPRFSDLGEGTRLSFAIQQINSVIKIQVGKKPVVTIISDGLGTESEEKFGIELRKLKRLAYKVFWANPLSGHKSFVAKTKSLKTIKKQFKVFHATNSISGILELVKLIQLSAQIT